MWWKHLTAVALGLIILGVWGTRLTASEEKKSRAAEEQKRLDTMAEKLGLSADQKEQVKKIQDEYREKTSQLDKERRDAVSKVLTPDQQTKFKEMIKEFRQQRPKSNNSENNNNKNNNNENK